MNALTLLKQDHENVEALFDRFERAGPDAYEEKAHIAEKAVELLSVHAAVEEEVFYPAIRVRLPEETAAVLEALEEHHAAKIMLAEIDRLAPGAERFDAKMTVLIESVRHHVTEEEGSLFPTVRDAFTAEELNKLGETMEAAKRTAPTRPHPHQPDTPPLNIVLGVPVAILDRAMTAGRKALNLVTSRR